jgi:phosphoribosylaminoimidazolecarboxamide formyltransferase/IMP cyclohydrolase
VAIACEPSQYARILEQIERTGATTPELRRELAAAAFAHTAEYDRAIAAYFAGLRAVTGAAGEAGAGEHEFPDRVDLSLKRVAALRYGENPHQAAAVYAAQGATPGSLVRSKQLHGKELSYNNLLDLDSALAAARSIPAPGVAVIKHNNPCGAATATTLAVAMQRAWDGDPLSAFGSVIAFNVAVDAAAAEFLAEPGRFVEAIIAPEFSPEAIEILTTKPKWKANVRLLAVGKIETGHGGMELRQIGGGMLCQSADDLPDDESSWQTVTTARPTEAQIVDLHFAWAVCGRVKSNAIVIAKDQTVVGVGAGQMSRVDSVEIAIHKAGPRAAGAALASDAFFPFQDSIERAAASGVTTLIQPGGSRGDAEVIAACNQHGLVMVFTGRRHFRH